ncbi:hypothetical protein GIB67_037853 [Kingdonia uniflora]|uniref:Retrotransposon gag domain-containing protein n=1 Tax=Kingdonia uniflora TaxID=39325 RepID=A0A7J7LGW5_9MAGN|nr:hypothetical protein GIB67_037853 [Kingdonia uniflora]
MFGQMRLFSVVVDVTMTLEIPLRPISLRVVITDPFFAEVENKGIFQLFQVLVAAEVIFGELSWKLNLLLLQLGLLRRASDIVIGQATDYWILGSDRHGIRALGGYPMCVGQMARGGRGRSRAVGRGRKGFCSGAPADEPVLSQKSLGSVPIEQGRSPAVREYKYLEQLQKYKHPSFFGTLVPSEAETWFKSIEKTLNAMKCPENQRVTLATYLVQGEGNHWWDTAKRTIAESYILWASFQDRFLELYFPQSYRDSCISEFYMLEQGDMSISQYDQRFNELSRHVPFIIQDEEKRMMKFLKGLRPYYQKFLISSGPSLYKEVLSKALAI